MGAEARLSELVRRSGFVRADPSAEAEAPRLSRTASIEKDLDDLSGDGSKNIDESLERQSIIPDDDVNRVGNEYTVFLMIILAVIGSGVLSVGSAFAMLGWVAAPMLLVVFAVITWGMAVIISEVHVVNGVRHHSYRQLVGHLLGDYYLYFLVVIQQLNLFLTGIAYTIAGASSFRKIAISVCNQYGTENCFDDYWKWALIFGAIQLLLAQVPDLHHFVLLSAAGAFASFGYSLIAMGLGFSQEPRLRGNVQGKATDTTAKTFGVFNALGALAFCFGFFMVVVEIQDTIKSRPGVGVVRPMRRALGASFPVMFLLYLLVAVSAYLAFGNTLTGNIITQFDRPYWVINLANALVLLHMIPAVPLYLNPVHLSTEQGAKLLGYKGPRIVFRLVFRSALVIVVVVVACCLPFFGSFAGLVGAIGFWPTTVFLPTLAYQRVHRPTGLKKYGLYANQVFCGSVTLLAVIGSVYDIVRESNSYKPFSQ